jgi:uncharacterized protein
MPKWTRILLAIIASLLLLLLTGVLAVSRTFADTVLSAPPLEKRRLEDVSLKSPVISRYPVAAYQNIPLRTADGLQIQGFYYPSQNGAAMLLLHGYRSNHTMMVPIANMLVQHGYGVLMIDFRGHGLSEGNEVTFGKKEVLDADAAFQYLQGQPGIDPLRIAVLGNSMGASTAILYGAQNPRIRAVIAQSPFASMKDIIRVNTKRSLPVPPILLTPFVELWVQNRLGTSIASIAPIQQIHSISPRPVFIMMGGKDIMTDPRSGQRLIDAAGEPKILWYDAEVGHLEFQEKYPGQFETQVAAFLQEYLK